MKHNRVAIQAQRRTGKKKGKSRYADKAASGKQTYGPGCCANARALRRPHPQVDGSNYEVEFEE